MAQIPWTRNELILATDLLARNNWRGSIGVNDPRLVELSALLRSANFHEASERDETFRSPGSVRFKYSNIYSQHPSYGGTATKGIRLDKEVLEAFLADPEGMASQAATLRTEILTGSHPAADAGEEFSARADDGRAVTRGDLGAWVLKCNPDVYDLPSRMARSRSDIDGAWSVQDNYRSHMMRPGDRALFWVTESKYKLPRGIWGAGRVVDTLKLADRDDDPDWLDEGKRDAVEYVIPFEVSLFDDPVTNADLVASGIDDLEIQRIAQVGNPSYVTSEQWQRLAPLVFPDDDGEPDDVADGNGGSITVTGRGAGFGSPMQNRAVELAAMAVVKASYPADEWSMRDVSHKSVGWDITFRRKSDGQVHKVEVKGVSGSRPIVLLTKNEHDHASTNPGWLLAVVTNALTDEPTLRTYSADEAISAATPFVHRVDLR